MVFEEYPENYLAWAHRMHRWVRGDWQLLPWLRRHVPIASGERVPTRFRSIDRWKIVDNLRRSLVPIQSLNAATQRIADNDFETQLVIESGDEFEDLARSFNDMSAKILERTT